MGVGSWDSWRRTNGPPTSNWATLTPVNVPVPSFTYPCMRCLGGLGDSCLPRDKLYLRDVSPHIPVHGDGSGLPSRTVVLRPGTRTVRIKSLRRERS